jgi:hypothetical protein
MDRASDREIVVRAFVVAPNRGRRDPIVFPGLDNRQRLETFFAERPPSV